MKKVSFTIQIALLLAPGTIIFQLFPILQGEPGTCEKRKWNDCGSYLFSQGPGSPYILMLV